MSMGIVSDSDFESELKNSEVKIPVVIKKQDEPNKDMEIKDDRPIITSDVLIKGIKSNGRAPGDIEVPHELRALIGDTHLHEGRQAALTLAKDLGISSSSVSAYANGATSTKTYHNPDNDLKSLLNSRKQKLSKKALNRLNLALGLLTDEKLEHVKARDLSGIAKDMAQVAKNLEPEKDTSGVVNNGPTFIMYTPQMRQESHYETIEVKDNI